MLKDKNFRFDLGLLLLAGLAATTYSSPILLSYFKKSPIENDRSVISQIKYSVDPIAQSQNILADGTYLYGQSDRPEQICQEYLVFEVKQNQVVGASYYPQSEFACFYGTLTSDKMSLFVIQPYDRTVHPYSINLESSSVTNSQIGLEGYQRIENISDNDLRILNSCSSE